MGSTAAYTDDQFRRYAKPIKAKGRLILAGDRYDEDDAHAIADGVEAVTGREVLVDRSRRPHPVGGFVLTFDADPEDPDGHDCWTQAVPYESDGALGHGWECGVCGRFLQAG